MTQRSLGLAWGCCHRLSSLCCLRTPTTLPRCPVMTGCGLHTERALRGVLKVTVPAVSKDPAHTRNEYTQLLTSCLPPSWPAAAPPMWGTATK